LSTTTQSSTTLNNGVTMPALGFGAMTAPDQSADVVAQALRSGYRLIDTAAGYRNEEQVGQGIRDSGIDRDDIFVTRPSCGSTTTGTTPPCVWSTPARPSSASTTSTCTSVRAYLPHLLDRVLSGHIDPGKVFDLTLPLSEVAEAYAAMDERRAIKTILMS